MRLISAQELKEKLDRGDPLKLVNARGDWEYRPDRDGRRQPDLAEGSAWVLEMDGGQVHDSATCSRFVSTTPRAAGARPCVEVGGGC